MSLCWSMVGLVIGAGSFVLLGLAGEHADGATTVTPQLVYPQLVYPQRPPRDFLPGPSLVDDELPTAEHHAQVVRHQLALTAQLARAAASAAVRARPLALTVKPVPATAPPLETGTRVQTTVSYYYCTPGPSGRRVGDGGNFCGTMRNGVRVHSGAAACAYRYLGQRFRIEGDPTGRTYTCEDTGSAVHGLHRDIWFNTADSGRAWQAVVGRRAIIEIVP